MIKPPANLPLAYLITYTCYGTWLHGEEKGSVDDEHDLPGTPFVAPNLELRSMVLSHMDQPPFEMDQVRREIVRDAIAEVCRFRKWELMALHVRSNHLHSVVVAGTSPEKVMNDFKAYSSRALNTVRMDATDRKRWTRHGSTRYLWHDSHVAGAVHYTLFEQGEPMATYPDRPSRARQEADLYLVRADQPSRLSKSSHGV